MNIEDYNSIEYEYKKKLSNLIIEAFSPFHFEKSGYPSKIYEYKELVKFIDVMQENRYFQNLKKLNYLSKKEFNYISKIANDILRFAKTFKVTNKGRNCLTRALISKRIHNYFLQNNDSVFEIGPGSGYYASICYETNIKYFGLEITQALYLYQSNFYNFTYSNQYSNFAIQKNHAKINLIPWWQWVSKNQEFKFNLVTANHVLCEMHPNSLLYTFKKVIDLYQNPNKKILICEGLGSKKFSSNETVIFMMKRLGWILCSNLDDVYIFIHSSSSEKFKKQMLFKRSINFKYLFYVFKYEKKNIFHSLFKLIKILKKHSYIGRLENRYLTNYNFLHNAGNKDFKITKLNEIFDNNKDNNLTDDEIFLNYININYF